VGESGRHIIHLFTFPTVTFISLSSACYLSTLPVTSGPLTWLLKMIFSTVAFISSKSIAFTICFPTDVNELGRGKVNTIVEHDDINLWDIGMMRFCCWRLFCGNLYRLGFCVTAVGRPTAEYPGYFGFSLGFNTPSLDSRMYRFWFM
jgi:hypothetical protein